MQFLCNEPRLPDVFVNFTLPRAAVRLPPPPVPPPASPGSLTPPAPHCPGFAPRRRCAARPAGGETLSGWDGILYIDAVPAVGRGTKRVHSLSAPQADPAAA
jgi:hypothetical protein